MYGKYKKRPFRGKSRKMSPAKKAYLAGVKAGMRMAGKSRFKRWY